MREGKWKGSLLADRVPTQDKTTPSAENASSLGGEGLVLQNWRSDLASNNNVPTGVNSKQQHPNQLLADAPKLIISLDSERKIQVTHDPPLKWKGEVVTLKLHLDRIDLESLLLKAIRLHIYTRLHAEEQKMKRNKNLCRVPSDIRLRYSDRVGESTISKMEDEHADRGGHGVTLVYLK